MSTLPRMRLARRLDVPKDATILPASFASSWLDGSLHDPEVWDEIMDDFLRATGLHVPDSFTMEDDDFEAYVRPRLEWALRSGELVLVETMGEPIERYLRPAGAQLAHDDEDVETESTSEKPKEEPKRTWVEIEMVGGDDKGLPGIRYRLKLGDGTTREGRTSESGIARIDDLDPRDDVELSFPDLDQEAWDKA